MYFQMLLWFPFCLSFPSHFVVFCFSEPPYLSHSHSKDDFLSGIYVIPQIEGEKDKAVHGVTFIPLILHPSQYKYSTVWRQTCHWTDTLKVTPDKEEVRYKKIHFWHYICRMRSNILLLEHVPKLAARGQCCAFGELHSEQDEAHVGRGVCWPQEASSTSVNYL